MISFIVFFSVLIFDTVADQFDKAIYASVLRGTKYSRGRRQSRRACLVLISEKMYADRHGEDQPLECELHVQDRKPRAAIQVVRIKGLSAGWARKHQVRSGKTTLYAAKSIIDDASSELIIPFNGTVKLFSRKGRYEEGNGIDRSKESAYSSDFLNRKVNPITRKVLVLRIAALDVATTLTEFQLADDVFGIDGDPSNLNLQISQCSYGQLQFQPVISHELVGLDGVYTVSMPTTNVTGKDHNVIAWEAVNKAQLDLNMSLTSLADHVMICMPPGTGGGAFVAYAYVDHWLSVYNDMTCKYVSVQLHELGHNINLAHSGERSSAYGDQSCTMGFGYGVDDGPNQCFNGPKTWQLGWFSSYHVELLPASGFSWTGNLIGFAEQNSAAADDKMIIRIQSTVDTYIHFNRAAGFNSATQEGADKVLITTRPSGTDYAPSNLEAKLSSNEFFAINDFNGSSNILKITVNSIITESIPGRAKLSIELVSNTTVSPTSTPSFPPTSSPTAAPTLDPTVALTAAPTRNPTITLTAAPTQNPTITLTVAPTQTPTAVPTVAPTRNPSRPPTFHPTQRPPTVTPTRNPTTAKPTRKPTSSRPTRKPTTLRPTRKPR